jgi:hypothetical protein
MPEACSGLARWKQMSLKLDYVVGNRDSVSMVLISSSPGNSVAQIQTIALFKGSEPLGQATRSASITMHCRTDFGARPAPLHPSSRPVASRCSVTGPKITGFPSPRQHSRRTFVCIHRFDASQTLYYIIVRKDMWPQPRPSHIRKTCSLQRLLCKAKVVCK